MDYPFRASRHGLKPFWPSFVAYNLTLPCGECLFGLICTTGERQEGDFKGDRAPTCDDKTAFAVRIGAATASGEGRGPINPFAFAEDLRTTLVASPIGPNEGLLEAPPDKGGTANATPPGMGWWGKDRMGEPASESELSAGGVGEDKAVKTLNICFATNGFGRGADVTLEARDMDSMSTIEGVWKGGKETRNQQVV